MTRAVTRLLVANRGEIARRVFRTCREMGIETVAVFSTPDASAPFVAEADHAVHLDGASPADTYLRVDLLLAAAAATGADAVHPGYGFLSESAAFARAVLDAGLVWVGPSPEAIEAMGDKLRAKELMAAAGVPVLPGGLVTEESAAAVAADVGFPLLVKASAGGGGRGMRLVTGPADLAEAVASATSEAAAAFGDGTVFLERFVERPRHVEVQVMGDAHGQVVALFERDCSVQRRHQKVVEEAPSPAVSEALRAELTEAAVAAARAVSYVGAGTVELVLAPSGEFFFLEMNTRLQVEHPVTEMVTGLDLVRLQLQVAAGLPLEVTPTMTGHAVEARLYAEDVAAGYLPTTGTLSCFEVPPGVRVDSAVESGSVVSVHYDAMLAKLVAHAPTRDEACAALASALARTRVHGVVTNRDLLVSVLRSPEFLAGDADTGFLERHPLPAPDVPLHRVAAALAGAASRTGRWPSGWRNVPSQPQTTTYDGVVVAYRHRRDGLDVWLDGEQLDVRLWSVSPSLVDLTADGLRHRFAVHLSGETAWVDSALGSTTHHEDPRFPEPGTVLAAGALTAPMPGTVLRVLVTPGDPVAEGEPLLVLEAMKMEHAVRAPAAGVVASLAVTAGDQVDAGAVLAVVEPAGG